MTNSTRSRLWIVARITWLSVCAAAVAFLTATYNDTFNRDNEIVLAYALLLLGFPASVLAAWAIGGIAYTADRLFGATVLPNGRTGMVATSLFLVMAGYVQWFYLLPRLWRWAGAKMQCLVASVKSDS